MERVLIFAHYSKTENLSANVQDYLEILRAHVDVLVLVTSSFLSAESKNYLTTKNIRCFERENTGYDFFSWRAGLHLLKDDLIHSEELLLVNDSCFVIKNSNLDQVFAWAKNKSVWSLTKSYEYSEHMQSFFMGFKKDVFLHSSFEGFWNDLKVYDNKNEIIQNYEIELSKALRRSGIVLSSYFDPKEVSLPQRFVLFLLSLRRQPVAFLKFKENFSLAINPTHDLWEALIQKGIPLVKRELVEKNPLHLNLRNLQKYPRS